jgi:hypothetical protein
VGHSRRFERGSMSEFRGDSHGGSITTLTTGEGASDLVLGLEALWLGKPLAIPFGKLKLLFQSPAIRPDELARARYHAAWYQIEQPDLAAAA